MPINNGLDTYTRGEPWPYWDSGTATTGFDTFTRGEPFRALFAAGTTAFTASPSGGVQLGGTASISIGFSAAPAGGVQLGGTTDTGTTFNASPAGGVQLGCTVAIAVGFSVTPAGGVQLGGTVSPVSFSTTSVQGVPLAWWFWFAESSVVAYTVVPSGGVQLGGTVSIVQAFTAQPSGGVQLGGTVSILTGGNTTVTPSGGIQLGGTAAPVLGLLVTPAGGVQLGGTTPFTASNTQIPTSLQNAIKIDWYGTSGFSSTIGPLHFDQAPAGTTAPFVVMGHPMELPGETADDAAVEIAFQFYAASAATTRRLGRLFIAWVSRLEEVLSARERYWWETGVELGNLIDSSAPIKVPKKFTDGQDLFRYTVLVRFLIDGRP